jgi:hypothetical protein
VTAYQLTPVGAAGVEPERTEEIPGPLPRDAVSVARLHLKIGQLEERLAAEQVLRMRAHRRLDHCARVFAVLSHVYPELRGLIARARKDIWS